MTFNILHAVQYEAAFFVTIWLHSLEAVRMRKIVIYSECHEITNSTVQASSALHLG